MAGRGPKRSKGRQIYNLPLQGFLWDPGLSEGNAGPTCWDHPHATKGMGGHLNCSLWNKQVGLTKASRLCKRPHGSLVLYPAKTPHLHFTYLQADENQAIAREGQFRGFMMRLAEPGRLSTEACQPTLSPPEVVDGMLLLC